MAESQVMIPSNNRHHSLLAAASPATTGASNSINDSEWVFHNQQQHHHYYYEDSSSQPQPQDDDPYVYSDDSASLSDAYFRQSDSPSPSPHFPLAPIQTPLFIPYSTNHNFYPFFEKPSQQPQQPLPFAPSNQSCFWSTSSIPYPSENEPLVRYNNNSNIGETAAARSYGSDFSLSSSATTESSLAYGLPGNFNGSSNSFRKHEIYGSSILEDVPEIIEEKNDEWSALYRRHQQQQLMQQYAHPPRPRSRSPSPTLLVATATAAATGFRKIPPVGKTSEQHQQQRRANSSPSSSSLIPVHRLLLQQQQQQQQQRRLKLLESKQRERLARELAVSKVRGQSQEEDEEDEGGEGGRSESSTHKRKSSSLSCLWCSCSFSSYHDVGWAVLFLLQLTLIMYFAAGYYFVTLSSQPSHPATNTSTIPTTTDAFSFLHNSTLFSTFSPPPNDDRRLTTATATTAATAASASSSSSNNFGWMETYEFVNLITWTGCFAGIVSYLSFGFMLIVARAVIHVTLIVSILLAMVWTVLGWTVQQQQLLAQQNTQQQPPLHGAVADDDGFMQLWSSSFIIMIMIPVLGCAALALAVGYTFVVWNRIDLAATNLYTALCAMRCTADIALLGLASLFVAFGWCLVWSLAALGIHQTMTTAATACRDQHYVTVDGTAYDDHEDCDWSGRYVIATNILLCFSFYWTIMVIKNVVRVVVASAVGSWWFQPLSVGPCCSNAVRKPLIRSLTKSFGSICLGSLVVFPAQILMTIISCCVTRPGNEVTTTKTVTNQSTTSNPTQECDEDDDDLDDDGLSARSGKTPSTKTNLLDRVYHLLRNCNRWSYSYIGMYGYSFAKGGEKAIQLFETREWLEVVNENLPRNVLLMASLVIGGSTGCFAVLAEEVNGMDFLSTTTTSSLLASSSASYRPMAAAFGIGSILGFCLSNVLLLGVVGSAVNTVLICFAAGPFEFDKNHPRLSREMREVWSQQVWEPAV